MLDELKIILKKKFISDLRSQRIPKELNPKRWALSKRIAKDMIEKEVNLP